jgi:hypothetical protein
MAKKEIVEPSTRSTEFLSGQRPLLLSDLTPEERTNAFEAVSAHTSKTRENLAKFAAKVDHPNKEVAGKAKRAQRALDEGAVDRPYNHEDAIANTMQHFENSAKNPRAGESVHGVDFYSRNAAPIHDLVVGRNISPQTAFEATAKLSNKNRPGNEKSSLTALLNAHEKGSVTYTPEFVNKVHSVITGSHRISAEEVGKTVPFSQVHPQVVAAMTVPDVRESVTHALHDVDLAGISKGGMRQNISSAHSTLQTGKGNDPYTNPKFASYSMSHAEAPLPGTPEHQEYNMRAANIHDVLTGKVSGSQLMLDYHGLRDKNEGHLSNVAPTANDLHHRRLSYNQPAGAPYAAAGDLTMSAKGNVAKGDTKISGDTVEHAVLQDVVHETAKRLQEKHNLQYSVPSRMVNEAAWASTRVMTGDDPNPAKKEADAAHGAALKEQEKRNSHRASQMELF